MEKEPAIYDAEQLLLAEVIARSFAWKCGYAIFFPYEGVCPKRVSSVIERQGFVKAPEFQEDAPLFLVDMHAPLLLMQNLETTLKEPFSSNPRVLKAIYKAHHDLQRTMTGLYPGQLVLSLSASLIYHRLVDKITTLNGVPREPVEPRILGEYMCVPFGKILRGKVIPNTVTKTLHTDKVFDPELKDCLLYTSLFDETVSIEELRRTLEAINADPGIHGCLIFRPLPPHLDEMQLSGILRPEKDADVITAAAMGQMVTRTGNDFAPCTAAACLELLRYYRIPLKGKRVTVIGKGINVGLSIALLLLNEEATVSVCHIFTAPAEVRRLCREAEIIVSAAGCAGLIGAEHEMCIRDSRRIGDEDTI